MAPPAGKRRKLEHSDSEAESDGSFAGFDETDHVDLAGSSADDGADGSDVSMDGLEGLDDDDSGSEDEEEDGASGEHESVHPSRKRSIAAQPPVEKKPQKAPVYSLQNGAYTAESFKSNMFKLQVDELLEQVKPRYGKKEAPAENAMRTLKNILEQIPSRAPLPVRLPLLHAPIVC